MQIIRKPVKNFTEGRKGYKPEAFIIQCLNKSAIETLNQSNNPDSKFSIHYLITSTGVIWQLVEDEHIALHSPMPANSKWKLVKSNVSPNLYTIGIGIEIEQGSVWGENIYLALASLVSSLSSKWKIPVATDYCIGVSDINNLVTKGNPGAAVNYDKIVSMSEDQDSTSLEQKKNSLTPSENANQMREISNLKLRYAALEREMDLLNKSIDQDPREVNDLLRQNTKLSEQLYLLQQENQRYKNQLQSLEAVVDLHRSHLSPNVFSTKELLNAIIGKIFGTSR